MKKIKEAFLNASKCEKCAFVINLFSSIIVITQLSQQIFPNKA